MESFSSRIDRISFASSIDFFYQDLLAIETSVDTVESLSRSHFRHEHDANFWRPWLMTWDRNCATAMEVSNSPPLLYDQRSPSRHGKAKRLSYSELEEEKI